MLIVDSEPPPYILKNKFGLIKSFPVKIHTNFRNR